MTTIAIPDIHHKTSIADRIVDRYRESLPLHVIYLGDYFDDFRDSPGIAGETARWLRDHLDRHEEGLTRDFLIGNHDAPYLYPELNRELSCAGYTPEKALNIASWLHRNRYRNLMKLHTVVGSWLLTHAGLTKQWVGGGFTLTDASELIMAVKDGLDRGIYNPLLGAGYERGGDQAYGGITWCDWNNFTPVDGFSQLVGHTPHVAPALRKRRDTPRSRWDIDLDSHLRHYAIYHPESDSWETVKV